MSQTIECSPILAADQVRLFVDDGFLILPGLVTPDEADELRADTVKLARGGCPCPSLQPMPSEPTDQPVAERILCIHQPHYIGPVIMRFVSHARICALLRQVTAARLPLVGAA